MARKSDGPKTGKGKNGSGWDVDTTTIAILRSDGKVLTELRQGEEANYQVVHRLILEHVLHARVAKAIYEGVAEPAKIVFETEVTAEEARLLEAFLKARREGTIPPAG